MDEDVLSDVVPSNIVSRQVSPRKSLTLAPSLEQSGLQPSEGADGESEFMDDGGADGQDEEEVDELQSEEDVSAPTGHACPLL
jgi:hypothetical protein